MLSLICEVDFKENDNFRCSKSYANLYANRHVENLIENRIFSDFIRFTKDLYINEETNESTVSKLSSFVKDLIISDETDKNELLSLGISCLQSFAQINWLGPVPAQLSKMPSYLINANLQKPDANMKVFSLVDFFDLNGKVIFRKFLKLI